MTGFTKIFIFSLIGTLIVIFQNCGTKVNFKSEASQSEEASPTPVSSQSRSRTPASVAPPPPPLTLLQKAELLCPNTKTQSGVTWSKVDWLKPENDPTAAPPCLIKDLSSAYLIEKCSDAGFQSLGATLNTGKSTLFQSAKGVSEFLFPSSGGSFYANIMYAGNISITTSGNVLLNALEVEELNLSSSTSSCVIMNKGDRIISDAFTTSSSTKLALFGLKANNIKGTLDFLHMKNVGNGNHEVFIIDTDVNVVKIESKFINLNLKNTTILTLCTTNNTIISAAEESGVGTYISDLTDPRCNPVP